jgi:glycosyltransferase involved in cell wall biosynthesis
LVVRDGSASGEVGFVHDLDTNERRAKLRLLACVREAHLDNIPCLQSLLSYLAEHRFEVEVLCTQDPRWLRPTAQQPQITYRVVAQRVPFLGCCFRVPVTVALLAEGIARFRGPSRPDVVLSCGALGGIVAWMLAKLFRARHIYQMLELPVVDASEVQNSMPAILNWRSDDQRVAGDRRQQRPKPWSQRLIDAADRRALRTADVVIAHDTYRADFSSRALHVPATRFELLPNAPRGGCFRKKTSTIAERLNIPAGSRIALHFGGVGDHFDLLRLAQSAASWPPGWCLVIHTSSHASSDEYVHRLRATADSSRVYFSFEPVPSSEADQFVASADVGLATYSVEELGYRAVLMGLASGKIARYLRCGLPVIASELPSVRTFLQSYNCGVCVSDSEGIGKALGAIAENYSQLRENAFTCYEQLFEPERYCSAIESRARSLIARPG